MSSYYAKVLKLAAWNPVINGCGERLEITLDAFKPDKKGNAATWRGSLVLNVDRYFIKRLADEIANMQRRDRVRLAEETVRLDVEVEPLQKR